MNAKQLLSKLNSFDIDFELKHLVYDNEKKILDLNKKQLSKGENTKGVLIGVYSHTTEKWTKDEHGFGFPKKANEPYNIFDTGKTQRLMTIDYNKGKISIYSVASTIDELFDTIKEHGFINNPETTLFGLTIEDEKFLSYQILLPDFQKRFKSRTGLS